MSSEERRRWSLENVTSRETDLGERGLDKLNEGIKEIQKI